MSWDSTLSLWACPEYREGMPDAFIVDSSCHHAQACLGTGLGSGICPCRLATAQGLQIRRLVVKGPLMRLFTNPILQMFGACAYLRIRNLAATFHTEHMFAAVIEVLSQFRMFRPEALPSKSILLDPWQALGKPVIPSWCLCQSQSVKA